MSSDSEHAGFQRVLSNKEAITWPGREAPFDIPEGFHLIVVDEFERGDHSWRRVMYPKKCRMMVGPAHTACGRPAVAEINRSHGRSNFWAYCELHCYGRKYEDGKLLTTILVADSSPSSFGGGQ